MRMITLEYQGARMEIDELGAEMRGFCTADGRDWGWRGDPQSWKSSAPVLFPFIGALKDGGVTIDGTVYPMTRHGFAKFQRFTVYEQGEDFVTFLLTDNEETRKIYPFAFALTVTHRFLKNGFETRYTVESHTGRPMPFVIGGHPGFNCPMREGERFEDYVLHFEKPEAGKSLLCTEDTHLISGETMDADLGEDGRTLALDHCVFDRIDTYIFASLNSRWVELIHKDTRKGLRLSFDMPVLAVWSMPGANAPYVCLEPWQGLPAQLNETGRFEDKPYQVTIGPGEAYSCGYRMEIVD